MSSQNPEIKKPSSEKRPLTHMSPEQEKTLQRELDNKHLAGIAEQEYSALFLPLGILRTLKERTFSEDERRHILSVCETAINGFFGYHTDLFFTKKMWEDAMQNPSTSHIETCIDAIAANIRAWAEFCKKHANIQEIEAESQKRKTEGETQDPLYNFIKNQEIIDVANGLESASQDVSQAPHPESDLFYRIGHAQRLAVLVEKLAPRIESGEIEIDLDISEIREAIARAQESLVRALQKRDHEADATDLPKMSMSKVDKRALEELEKIAQTLKGQKVLL